MGYVTFRLAGRVHACPLEDVREVVRGRGVEPLLGAVPPVVGLLDLRGEPLPVADPRPVSSRSGTGDVLVLAGRRAGTAPLERLVDDGVPSPSGGLGLVVDEVLEVLDGETLPAARGGSPEGLPDYVVEVRQDSDGRPVLVVDPRRLAGTCGVSVVASGVLRTAP